MLTIMAAVSVTRTVAGTNSRKTIVPMLRLESWAKHASLASFRPSVNPGEFGGKCGPAGPARMTSPDINACREP